MGRLSLVIAIAVALGVLAVGANLYSRSTSQTTTAEREAPAASPAKITTEEQFASDKREKESARIIARAADWGLTGDSNGHAEWRSANDDTVICGVTPEGRYLIVQNEIGRTRYDEQIGHGRTPFAVQWDRVDCAATSPVNQQQILAKAADERLYQETHPVDPECLTREMKELATGGAAAAKRQIANPHECNRTQSEWQATIRARAEGSTEVESAAH